PRGARDVVAAAPARPGAAERRRRGRRARAPAPAPRHGRAGAGGRRRVLGRGGGPPRHNGAVDLEPRRGQSGVDATRARAMNRGLVLSRVKADGPISRADLVRATGLAKATVSVIVDELVAA